MAVVGVPCTFTFILHFTVACYCWIAKSADGAASVEIKKKILKICGW